MPQPNITPQIFDPNLSGACIWDKSLMMNNCNFTMSDESNITQPKNISTILGPSIWVPVIGSKDSAMPPACVKLKSNIVCLHYPDEQTQVLNNLPPVVQQTFSKINSKTEKNLWVQDSPPNPITLINNPSDTTQIMNSDALLVQNIYDYKTSPNPAQMVSNYTMSPTIPIGSTQSVITLNPNSSNAVAFPYNDTSDIAPNCIINTPNCTLAAPTSKCIISCPTIDESNVIKYTYNKKNNLWVDPALNSLIS
jgi:hypothetical protein